jgi:hypothetical protein
MSNAGKGDNLRKGANLQAYWDNYDNIFRRQTSNVYNIQILTSSGWKTQNTAESLELAKAHYFRIGESSTWTGHSRIEYNGQSIVSTLDV